MKRLGMRTLVDWLEVLGMRIVINILVFILLCGSLALIGLTTSEMIDVCKDVLCVVLRPILKFSTYHYVQTSLALGEAPQIFTYLCMAPTAITVRLYYLVNAYCETGSLL